MKLFISLVVVGCFLGVSTAYAQKLVISNRDQFTIRAGYCIPSGSPSINDQPVLLANMKSGVMIEATYVTSLWKQLKIGVSGTHSRFEGWNHSSGYYDQASAILTSIGPTLIYKTWSPVHPAKNKLNFFGQVTPGISRVNVMTTAESVVNDGTEDLPLEVNSLRFFMSLGAGVFYNVSQGMAITTAAHYQYTQSDSQIFPDKSYSFFSLDFGLSFRLVKDKRYKLLN